MCIVAFTVSPTTITGFCNGNFTTTNNPGTYIGSTSSPKISFTGAGVGSWNGLVGYFSIYNKTLTNQEILQNFNSKLAFYLKKLDSNSICIFNEYFEEEILNEKGKICAYNNFSGAERKAKVLADFEQIGYGLAGWLVDTLLQLALLYVRTI